MSKELRLSIYLLFLTVYIGNFYDVYGFYSLEGLGLVIGGTSATLIIARIEIANIMRVRHELYQSAENLTNSLKNQIRDEFIRQRGLFHENFAEVDNLVSLKSLSDRIKIVETRYKNSSFMRPTRAIEALNNIHLELDDIQSSSVKVFGDVMTARIEENKNLLYIRRLIDDEIRRLGSENDDSDDSPLYSSDF